MRADMTRKRSSQPAHSSEAFQLLTRLAPFTQWWLRSDLPDHLGLFLNDLCHLLASQECLLYLEGYPMGILTLSARTEQAFVPAPAQLALPAEVPWSQIRDHWMNQRFAEVNAACQRVFLPLSEQVGPAGFAPLFSPGATMPLGLLLAPKSTGWEQEDDLLLSQVSTPLALRLANQQMRDQLEQRHLITTFVRLLCSTPLDPPQEEMLRRQARLLGLDLSQPHLVVLAQLATSSGGKAGMVQMIGRLKTDIEQYFPGALLILQESAEVFCLLPLTISSDQVILHLKRVVRDLQPSIHLLMGVSNASRTLQDYARGYEEAHDALAYAQHFHQGGVFQIHEVGPLRFLKLEEARGSRPTDRYSQAIQQLAEYDQHYHTDLVYTLEKFLLAGGRYSQAARMMEHEPGKAIAMSTVRQRVERMCEITEMDLLDSTLWLHLQLAIQVHRIQET